MGENEKMENICRSSFKHLPLKKFSGYTLIELLVVIAIIGILLTIGLAAYLDFNRRQVLTQAVYDLKSHLRLAEDKALNGEKLCSVCRGADGICNTLDDYRLEGWFLEFTSVSSYRIYGKCGGNRFSEAEVNLNQKGVFLTSPSPLPSPIRFKPLGHAVDITEASLTLTLTGPAGNSGSVKITKSGEIL